MVRKAVTAALVFIAFLLIMSLPHWSAISAGGVNLHEPDVETTAAEQPKKEGNSLGRALSAPFRALSRLFGGGKKDNQRPSQVTQKDIARFESAQVTRVNDARTPQVPAAPTGENSFAAHLKRGRELLDAG